MEKSYLGITTKADYLQLLKSKYYRLENEYLQKHVIFLKNYKLESEYLQKINSTVSTIFQ